MQTSDKKEHEKHQNLVLLDSEKRGGDSVSGYPEKEVELRARLRNPFTSAIKRSEMINTAQTEKEYQSSKYRVHDTSEEGDITLDSEACTANTGQDVLNCAVSSTGSEASSNIQVEDSEDEFGSPKQAALSLICDESTDVDLRIVSEKSSEESSPPLTP